MTAGLIGLAIVVFLLILLLFSAIKVAREYERGVVFRLGRLLPAAEGAGPLPPDPDHRPDGARSTCGRSR